MHRCRLVVNSYCWIWRVSFWNLRVHMVPKPVDCKPCYKAKAILLIIWVPLPTCRWKEADLPASLPQWLDRGGIPPPWEGVLSYRQAQGHPHRYHHPQERETVTGWTLWRKTGGGSSWTASWQDRSVRMEMMERMFQSTVLHSFIKYMK